MEPHRFASGRTVISAAVAAFLGALPLGCATVTAVEDPTVEIVDGYAYANGKATQDFAYPLATVRNAVDEAIQDLRVTHVKGSRNGVVFLREGRTADNRRVVVTLRPQEETTRLSIKVFWFGDEPFSRYFIDRVKIRLGILPPAAIEDTPPSTPDPNPFFSREKGPDSDFLRRQAELRFHDHEAP
jgi:hypothetical protein